MDQTTCLLASFRKDYYDCRFIYAIDRDYVLSGRGHCLRSCELYWNHCFGKLHAGMEEA